MKTTSWISKEKNVKNAKPGNTRPTRMNHHRCPIYDRHPPAAILQISTSTYTTI